MQVKAPAFKRAQTERCGNRGDFLSARISKACTEVGIIVRSNISRNAVVSGSSRIRYRPDTGFDFKSAQPLRLPDQNHPLHAGWRWQKATESKLKLSLDGHHTGAAGESLGACVFFEVLFGESCVRSTFVPPGISSAQARFLQETPPHTRRW